MLLGAHMSIAGGVHLAVQRAGQLGFNTMAMFVRNQRQWRAPPLTDQAVKLFKDERQRVPVRPVVAHASYLINLAAAGPVGQMSMAAITDEFDRCCRLGIEYYVLHPGSWAASTREEGIARLSENLSSVVAACGGRTILLLEQTAGAGSLLGGSFEELAEILAKLTPAERFGVCLDSCHLFAAGYDLRTPGAYAQTMTRFDSVVGWSKLGAFHMNDSMFGLGGRRDRHAHIGQGNIGLEGFANIVNDPRLANIPLILETKKETGPDGRDMDLVNAEILRSLVKKRISPQRTQEKNRLSTQRAQRNAKERRRKSKDKE